ncbi:MAG: hypothetical protein GY842_27295, partial [bacterium]|nr:hypothetical protein [bacterium]
MVAACRKAPSHTGVPQASFGARGPADRPDLRLALRADRLVVGAYGDEDGDDVMTGSAYAYNGLEGGRVEQTWDLDAVGNWDSTTVNGETQDRNTNLANEIVSLEGADDTSDADIAYDAAGNMTTMPRVPMPGY